MINPFKYVMNGFKTIADGMFSIGNSMTQVSGDNSVNIQGDNVDISDVAWGNDSTWKTSTITTVQKGKGTKDVVCSINGVKYAKKTKGDETKYYKVVGKGNKEEIEIVRSVVPITEAISPEEFQKKQHYEVKKFEKYMEKDA